MTEVVERAVEWYCSSKSPIEDREKISSTRDVFQARLDTFYQEILAPGSLIPDETALLTAVLGEIGNNCFDHNLGQWRDVIGCWFSWTTLEEGVVSVIADRGQGILSSLKRVKPDLKTEDGALKVAFERKLSGRSPEQRGNGLKFVRSVINQNPKRGLLFFSGSSQIRLGGNASLEKIVGTDKLEKKEGSGTFAVVVWGS